jgi:hypothetical protein
MSRTMIETVRLSPGHDGRLMLDLMVTARFSETAQGATGDRLTLSLGPTPTGESPLAAGETARIGHDPLEVPVIWQHNHVIRAAIRVELVLNTVGGDLRPYQVTGWTARCSIVLDDGTTMRAHAALEPASSQAGSGVDAGLDDGTMTPVGDAMPRTMRRRMPGIRPITLRTVPVWTLLVPAMLLVVLLALSRGHTLARLATPFATTAVGRPTPAVYGPQVHRPPLAGHAAASGQDVHDIALPPRDRQGPKPRVARASSPVTSRVAPHRRRQPRPAQRAEAPWSGLLLNPHEVDFGHQDMNITSALHTVHLMNLGPTPFPIARLAIAGVEASAFSEVNACAGTVVAVNVACVIRVSFTPTTRGTHSARLVITDTAGHRHHIVLRGYS